MAGLLEFQVRIKIMSLGLPSLPRGYYRAAQNYRRNVITGWSDGSLTNRTGLEKQIQQQ